MFQTNVAEKIATHISCSTKFFSQKSCCLWGNVGKLCRDEKATDDNIIRRKRFLC